ncbi:hypothetical protein M0804_004011 [Polistes exclamans]|nr:hypothetical protein M0804_004011 [Polistes exclamans]
MEALGKDEKKDKRWKRMRKVEEGKRAEFADEEKRKAQNQGKRKRKKRKDTLEEALLKLSDFGNRLHGFNRVGRLT